MAVLTPQEIISWLGDEKNRTLVGWIGGGLVVFVGGAWKVYTFLVDRKDKDEKAAPSQTVSVSTGNANLYASGPGAIYHGPITFNPDPKEIVARLVEQNQSIDARLSELAAQVAREKGVEVAPLLAVLVKLGEKEVGFENIPKRLDAAADELGSVGIHREFSAAATR